MRLRTREWRRIGILALVTLVVAAVLVIRGIGESDLPEQAVTPTPEEVAPPSASTQVTESSEAGAAGTTEEPETEAEEPEVIQAGLGTFTGALTGPIQFGEPNIETELTFSVAVEDGIGVEATELALFVDRVLSDPRSWAGSPDYSFVRVPTGGSFQLVVSSPDTTDTVCAPLQTIGQLSCAVNGVVAINLVRWETGSRGWTGTLEQYREWVINHEIGHQLGLSHLSCPGVGELAPLMQQQSIDLEGCEPNPWPFPGSAEDAETDPEGAGTNPEGAGTGPDDPG